MTIYSIDLGIDPAATGGHSGDELDPYPMQISLCAGFCDRAGSFVPLQLSSWFLFRASAERPLADQLLVRVFDLGDPDEAATVQPPTIVEISLYHLDGTPDIAWDPQTATTCSPLTVAPSLCYVNPDGKPYRCSQPQLGGHELRYVLQRPVATRQRRLLTLRAQAPVSTDGGLTFADKNFRADPEVIVSPYGG